MKKMISVNSFLEQYPEFKEENLRGRYIAFRHIQPLLENMEEPLEVHELGKSFLDVPIPGVKIGNGPKKVLGWSQMHGNEATTTKGLFDLFRLFREYSEAGEVKELLQKCTFLFIPMLNPDGAARYTRENVNKIDLNRDAYDLKESESKVLRNAFEDFQPDWCLNLHDQRTIFGAGEEKKPATLSFLAPAMDEEKSVPAHRLKAMQLIAAMNEELQHVIPGQIGRYGDDFNINCTGDTFQSLEVPTVLFEAGHYPADYPREETRKFFAFALFAALKSISSEDYKNFSQKDYEAIPENRKSFYDIILRDAAIDGKVVDVAIQFQEKMIAGEIHFLPQVSLIRENIDSFGHREISCEGEEVRGVGGEVLSENDIVELIVLKNEKLSIKSQNIP